MKQFTLGAFILVLLANSHTLLAQVQYLEDLQPEPYSEPVAGAVSDGVACGDVNCGGTSCGVVDEEIIGPVIEEPFCGPTVCGPIFEDPGTPVCNACMQPGCNGKCQRLIRRIGFWGGALVDIPFEGVLSTETSVLGTAAGFGIDPLILPAATEVQLSFDEQSFDDAYDYFYGYQANLTIEMDASTKIYVGYREVIGESDAFEIGELIVDPSGIATTNPLVAQFDDYAEYTLQVGFLTSQSWHRHVEFLWGGRGGVSFVDEIGVDFTSPGIMQVDDVDFFEESTILSFGVNAGLRWNIKPNLSIIALSGAEYRTSLDQADTDLDLLQLGSLNNGSGFATLPFYLGFTLKL